ncbi:MAG: flagellar basal-body MS-ring/collar protein FliF [Erythrobacter sp.]|nr:flagellar basal-body MS-ring/collar protein FliF [Erythrobacter sp.]
MAQAAVPAAPQGAIPVPPVLPASLSDWRERLSGWMRQPAIRRAAPALGAVATVAVVAALWLALASGPQRVLYASLSDAERAKVVEALERGGIGYRIDNQTGALSVSEDEVYRARMLVASDAGLAAPQDASAMLDAIPLGASRTLEGERLRLARERELMLTIRAIDGIETVRVHLATPERSVFVRTSNPPSASVMVRLASGRSLGQRQVEAIVNLVSGSVPGMSPDAVRVVDQNGQLLSSISEVDEGGLALQREFEAKLREQITTLLMPLLGDGNFTSQVQVELDQNESTLARERYDREGTLRSENERSLVRQASRPAGGIPGVTANTPPVDAELVDGAPVAQSPTPDPVPTESETQSQRMYELDREVALTSTRPGGLTKLSVAVAVSGEALAAAAPLTAAQLQKLVGAAVGANAERGDQVEIAVGAFEARETVALPFYEAQWFADVLRYGSALIAVVATLLFAVRPLIQRTKRSNQPASATPPQSEWVEKPKDPPLPPIEHAADPDFAAFPQRVEIARQYAAREPDRSAEALRRMMANPQDARAESRSR